MKQRLWSWICEALVFWTMLFGICTVLLVLVLLTLPFVDSGSPEFYVSILSLILIFATLAICVYVVRRCRTETY